MRQYFDIGLDFRKSAVAIRKTAPTGGRAWTTDRVEFGLDYIVYRWELCEWADLAGSTGLTTNGLGEFGLQPEADEEDNFLFLVWSQSVALGLTLSERSEMYFEYFTSFPMPRYPSSGFDRDTVLTPRRIAKA